MNWQEKRFKKKTEREFKKKLAIERDRRLEAFLSIPEVRERLANIFAESFPRMIKEKEGK